MCSCFFDAYNVDVSLGPINLHINETENTLTMQAILWPGVTHYHVLPKRISPCLNLKWLIYFLSMQACDPDAPSHSNIQCVFYI